MSDITDILNCAAQALYDKKGCNILVLDLRPLESMVEYCLICEGNVDRHVKTLAQHVEQTLEEELGLIPTMKEGGLNNDWVVVDYGEFVIHVMIPQMREKYCLEELWRKAEIVPVKIEVA